MYTGHTVKWKIIARLAWKQVLFFILYGVLIVVAYKVLDWGFLKLPAAPVSAIGIAVVFYVGLKNSSSYNRLWEARKIWGTLVVSSRQWGIQVMHFIGPFTRIVNTPAETGQHQLTAEDEAHLKATQRRLILRQIAFLNVLRVQLRGKHWWEEEHKVGQKIAAQEGHADPVQSLREEIVKFLPADEADRHLAGPNVAVEMLNEQAEEIRDLWAGRWLDSFHHVEMMRVIDENLKGQGASDRIKTFPFPRQYATFSRIFVWLFVLLLPYSLVGEIAEMSPDAIWVAVPVYVAIAWIFVMMEIVGGSSENPFENAVNDVPLTTLCITAEADLRRMLGDTDLPEKPKPVNDILM